MGGEKKKIKKKNKHNWRRLKLKSDSDLTELLLPRYTL